MAGMMARGGGLFKLIFGLVVVGGGWYTYIHESPGRLRPQPWKGDCEMSDDAEAAEGTMVLTLCGNICAKLDFELRKGRLAVDLKKLSDFVSYAALHSTCVIMLEQPDDGVLGWGMLVSWTDAAGKQYGWLWVDDLWNPQTTALRFSSLECPTAPPERAVSASIAERVFPELKKLLSDEEVKALAVLPDDEEEAGNRIGNLMGALDGDTPWAKKHWFRVEDSFIGQIETQQALRLTFMDYSRLFITPNGFHLEEPNWLAVVEALRSATPEERAMLAGKADYEAGRFANQLPV
jgi:hypothetical protein